MKRGLEIVSMFHFFLLDFWRKIFLTLLSINWRNFIAWLLLLLEILGSMCIANICFPGCDAINFELLKSLDKNVNISRTKKAFNKKQKALFIIFKELSNVSCWLGSQSGPLTFSCVILSNDHTYLKTFAVWTPQEF